MDEHVRNQSILVLLADLVPHANVDVADFPAHHLGHSVVGVAAENLNSAGANIDALLPVPRRG